MGLFSQLISLLIKSPDTKEPKKSTFKNKFFEVEKESPILYYQSAKEGTFDKTYFINPITGKFKFPNYNKDNKKFAVEIKDFTNYKENYVDGYSKAERDEFTLKYFEDFFSDPELEVECFEDFLSKLKPDQFDNKLGKTISLLILNEYSESFDEELEEFEFFEMELSNAVADKLNSFGYVTIYEDQYTQSEYLSRFSAKHLTDLCISYGIDPLKTKKPIIKQLANVNIVIPFTIVKATEKLRNYFAIFPPLYIKELKRNADRFHPAYIKAIFEYAIESNENFQVIDLLDIEIKSEYWKNRLEEKVS